MRGRQSQQGIAIITAISFMVVILAFISTAFIVSISNTRLSGDQVATTRAQLAAQAGIDEAILRIWHEATEDINRTGSRTGRRDIPDYRERWESVRTWSSRNDWGGANRLLGAVDANSVPIFGDPVTFTGQIDDGTGRMASYEVTIERRDDSAESSTLRITSTGTLPSGARRRLQQDLNVAYPPFQLDFAFLTDFVNCTFCHSAFTSIEMGYSRAHGMANQEYLVDLTDEDKREAASEGKQRIRVAGLNDMRISTGFRYLNTLIAGTIYTRGPQNIMRTDGLGGGMRPKANVFGPQYQAGSSLISGEAWEGFRPAQANDSKDLLLTCTPNENDGNAGCETRFARFYANYPLEREGSAPPIDGVIPAVQQFPSPIVDQNNDRRIDNDEWADVMRGKNIGQLKGAAQIWFSPTDEDGFPSGTGSVTLPFKVRGQDVTIPGLQTNVQTAPGRGIAGNLFLIGTDTNPIEIEGTVYVDGDLVIQGPIVPGNRGVFIVRKNIYIVGDVVYDCNGRAAGTNCTYYEPNTLPRLAMVAGGLMVMGDPNQSQTTKGFPNGFRSRGGTLPMQGELLAFNAKQYEKYEQARATARTLEESFVPRYYLYREGDELVMRCDFDGEPSPAGFGRGGTGECRDFVVPQKNDEGTKLRAMENLPCVGGQLDIYPDNQGQDNAQNNNTNEVEQPWCQTRVEEAGTPNAYNVIGIDVNRNGILDDDEPVVRDLRFSSYDDTIFQAFRELNNEDVPWRWNMTTQGKVGGIPVEQFDDDRAKLVGEIFVRDRNKNIINDSDGNPVEPAYIYMSPNRSWLAPSNDLNGNGVPDNEDVALEPMDKVYSQQRAIAAMEVLTGAWIQYGLNNGRSQNNQRPMRVDGLLFTNNAIVSYLPARGSRSHTAGGLILNGSIISYETGLLIYGTGKEPDGSNACHHGQDKGMFNAKNWLCVGLRLQYDRRLPSLIDVRIEVPVLLRSRSQWLPVN